MITAEDIDAMRNLNDADEKAMAEGNYVFELTIAALTEARKAMKKFPQPNYVITKVAEEAGEVVKAAVHAAEGREDLQEVEKEAVQAMAMIIRLLIEGDKVHGLPPQRRFLTGNG